MLYVLAKRESEAQLVDAELLCDTVECKCVTDSQSLHSEWTSVDEEFLLCVTSRQFDWKPNIGVELYYVTIFLADKR